jgi:hypothetical protein
MLVLRKLRLHLQDLGLVHFLHVVTHLETLQQAVGVVVPALDELCLVTEFLEVVDNLGIRVLVV